MTFLYFLEYSLIQCFEQLFCRIPLPLSVWIAKRLGDIAFYLMIQRRQVALNNIEKAFGQSKSPENKKKIALRAFENAAVSILELLIIPKIIVHAKDRFNVYGANSLLSAYAKGKGIILAISHLGSWEYLSFLVHLGITPCPGSVVVKSFKNPYLNAHIEKLRKMMGVTPIAKKSSAKKIFHELKQNHIVAILLDQWSGHDGIWADFFGIPTSTTSLPARLALRTGCAIIPAFCLRKAIGHYEVHILKEMPLIENGANAERSITEKLNQTLEQIIRQYPEEWLWGHRRWKSKPNSIREI